MGNPLNALYTAVAWVLKQIYDVLSPAFGPDSGWTWALSIVILVVLMRLIMVPLFVKQMHTTRKMSELAPEIKELKKKYKNDKQTLNQETMKVYQKAGVNPLMGCLPMVAQLPVWYALFEVLRYISDYKGGPTHYGLSHAMVVSAQHAYIFGATVADKVLFTKGLYVPLHAKIVIVLAVLISMVTTFLTVRQNTKRGLMPTGTVDNPLMGMSQKYMVYIMPLFALTGLYWQFGLVIYWVTTNIWTLGQQFVLLRRYPMPSAEAGDAPPVLAASGRARLAPGPAPSRKARPGPAAEDRKPGQDKSARRPSPPGSASAGTGPPGPARSGADRDRNGAGTGAAAGPGTGTPPTGTPPTGTPPTGTPKAGQRKGGRGPQQAVAAANGKPSAGGKSPAGGKPPSNGVLAESGGLLRRLGRGRPDPEPPEPQPEVKISRQQPRRPPRSKRSGKR